MQPTTSINIKSGGNAARVRHPAWRRRLDNLLINLTQRQPTNALYITISLLATGLLFVLFIAIMGLGTRVPSPHHDNLGSDVVANMADRDRDNLMTMAVDEMKYNPYSKMQQRNKNRLAIVIPYLPPSDGAPTFPSYFNLFAMSAAGSSRDIDYLIFHCFIPPTLLPDENALPSNVKLIDLNIRSNKDGGDAQNNECGLAKLFSRVTDERQKEDKMQIPLQRLISSLSSQIINLPYILVEYKPAFGHIFAEYLTQYSHWGYSDLDVVFGDMSRWIDNDEWEAYDIVTYGFGDQDKLYLRGQFTFHRNDPAYINQLWRHCKYLSEMDVRYAHPDTIKFESAEGCYSQAVISRKDIRVKWAVKAFTDVGEGSPIYTQGVYLSLGSPSSLTSSLSYHPKSVLYTAASVESGTKLLNLPTTWFEDRKKYPKYSEDNIPIQKLIGERTKVQTYRMLYDKTGDEDAKDVKCMYWAPKTYQMDICTVDGNVKSDEVVVLEKGILYKQKFVERKKLFPDGVKSFPFFHFQEWKRIYRTTELLPAHNTRQSNEMAGLIITKEGVLPLFAPDSSSFGWNFRHRHQSSSSWVSDTGSTATQPSGNSFCLMSVSKSYPKGATLCTVAASWPKLGVAKASSTLIDDSASVNIVRSPAALMKQSKMRGRKKAESKMSSSWWNGKLINANDDVTLTLTLQLTSSLMKEKSAVLSLLTLADSNIYTWGARQPSVLLIHVDSSVDEEIDLLAQTIKLINDVFAPDTEDNVSSSSTGTKNHLKNSLVAIVDSYESNVSRKALLNMAASAAPTRWLISGLELERGLVISREASVYASREARAYSDMPGHIFVIPQFASKRDDTRSKEDGHGRPLYSSVSADLLPSIRSKQTMTSNLSEYDCVKCSEDGTDDGVDDATEHSRRRLTDFSSISTEKNAEELLEDLWWDLSVADVYGTPGGFKGESSLGAMAKIHDRIELSLVSLLDRKGDHLDYIRYFDKSPILLVDRLGPKKEMMTLDLAPEVEDFGGRSCFHLLRLAQLAALGYKVSVLPGAFAASYPKTRKDICTESIQKSSTSQCDCELDSEGTIKEILIDEVKRPAKVAVLMEELDTAYLRPQ